MGPRVHDMELKDIIDIILKIRAGAYSFEASNPRHEHEWKVWKDAKVPDGTILIPGVITHSTVLVEHPELVAQRLIKYAEVVGRENVIAGTDCGFATFDGRDPRQHRVGEVRRAGEGRADREPGVVVMPCAPRNGFVLPNNAKSCIFDGFYRRYMHLASALIARRRRDRARRS